MEEAFPWQVGSSSYRDETSIDMQAATNKHRPV